MLGQDRFRSLWMTSDLTSSLRTGTVWKHRVSHNTATLSSGAELHAAAAQTVESKRHQDHKTNGASRYAGTKNFDGTWKKKPARIRRFDEAIHLRRLLQHTNGCTASTARWHGDAPTFGCARPRLCGVMAKLLGRGDRDPAPRAHQPCYWLQSLGGRRHCRH